jgi:mono/diheme cytochrome c family protein
MVTAGGQESAAMLAVLIAASDPYLAWPGRPAPAEASVVGEIEGARDLFARGKRLFTVCVTCHQSTGRGLPGFYPPLRDSPFVLGDPHRLALLLIHGLEGPLTVKGKKFDQLMPPAPLATDKDVAAIMTYVRQAWGNDGAAVAIEVVTAARAASADRAAPWTVDELNEAAKSSD